MLVQLVIFKSQTFGLATSKINGFTITAQSLSRDIEKGLVQISGDVKIIYQNQYFEADEVEINLKKKHAFFRGSVKIQSLEYNIGGDEISLDYFSNQALILNGFVQSSNVRFQGSMIEQRGPKTFFVVNADYTTCTNCPSTWSFEGSQIKAELGGYAFLKNSFLKVSGIPIFWLPYLIVPLKNERQSGFLIPEFGFIRDRNLVLSESFFWAISRSQDATFTLKNYELGGQKYLGEYRLVNDTDSNLQINSAFMTDSVFYKSAQYNAFKDFQQKNDSFTRWSLQAKSQQRLSDNLKARLKINLISDLQYPKDFSDEHKEYADSGLENRANITHEQSSAISQFDLIYYKHLLEANPLASNEHAVAVTPRIKLNYLPQKLSNSSLFYTQITAQFDAFSREKKWDDLSTSVNQKYASNTTNDPTCEHELNPNCKYNPDNNYNETQDLLRTGKRLKFKGSLLSQSFQPTSWSNVNPEVSYEENHYFFEAGQKKYNVRKLVRLNINSRSRLYNIYEQPDQQTKYKHELIPELNYTFVPFVDQEAHPFFGNIANGEEAYSSKVNISDADLNSNSGLQFDYDDRVYDRHLLTFSLLNRVIKKQTVLKAYKNILDFRLSQSYDLYQFDQRNLDKKQPFSDLSGVLNLNIDEFTLTNQFNYYPYLSATNSTTSLSYLNDQQQYFKIGYISKRTEDPRTDDVLLALGFVTPYINVLSGFIIDTSENKSQDASRLKQFSLITQLKPPGECWAINFYRDQKVGLEAEWKVRFVFSFDGKPPKVIPPDELNIR